MTERDDRISLSLLKWVEGASHRARKCCDRTIGDIQKEMSSRQLDVSARSLEMTRVHHLQTVCTDPRNNQLLWVLTPAHCPSLSKSLPLLGLGVLKCSMQDGPKLVHR